MTWRYRYEAKRIQSWILSSDRLRELKGGSECIEQLATEAELLAKLAGGKVLFTAAGNGELSFDNKTSLDSFASIWPMIAAGVAPGLPLVQGWTQDTGDRDAVFRELGVAPPQPIELPVPGPLSLRAGRTGQPAVGRGGDKTGLLDAATAAKERAADNGSRLARLLAAGLEFEEDYERWKAPYVAVIHADGNGVGARFQGLAGDAFRQASSKLKDATEKATAAALKSLDSHLNRRDGSSRIWARVVVLGGDDLTVIVPASDAVSFTQRYLAEFEKCTQAIFSQDDKLCAAAGIALVKSSFPFHRAYDLAEELCGVAKKKNGGTTSAAALHRVTTTQVESYRDLMARALVRREQHVERHLTMGAYDLGGLDRLSALVDALNQVPAGAIREWLRLAQIDPDAAERRWSRLEEVTDIRKLSSALAALGCTSGAWTEWSSGEGDIKNKVKATPIGDALALKMVSGRRARR